METEELINLSNSGTVVSTNHKGSSSNNVRSVKLNNNANKSAEDDADIPAEDEMEMEVEVTSDAERTTEEQMDYLEKCPCYAKCCIDSIITLFCVTLLG